MRTVTPRTVIPSTFENRIAIPKKKPFSWRAGMGDGLGGTSLPYCCGFGDWSRFAMSQMPPVSAMRLSEPPT